MDQIEVQGEWWLPGREARRVTGTLTFGAGKAARLSLIGAMRALDERGRRTVDGSTVRVDFGPEALEQSGVYPRIHGVAGGDAFNLEDCVQTNWNISLGGALETEQIHVNVVLRGAHFEADEPLEATAVSFSMRYFPHWVMESGLHESWSFAKEGASLPDDVARVTLLGRDLPDKQVTLSEGTTLTITQTLGISGDPITERSLTQGMVCRLDRGHKEPLPELIEAASDFQDLVSVGVGRTASFESVSFLHPDIHRRISENRTVPRPIDYFVEWADEGSRTEPERIHPHQMLFTLPDLGGVDGVQRWLEAAALHRTALGRVMSSRYRPAMNVSDQLLNRAAALEAFDRTASGTSQSRFTTRMKRCARLAGTPFTALVANPDRWIEVLRIERNVVAHHFSRQLPGGTEQYYLAEATYWLFVLCMLRAANAPDTVFDRIETHRELQWLAPRVQALL